MFGISSSVRQKVGAFNLGLRKMLARKIARIIWGIVENSQMLKVLPVASQNLSSVSKKVKLSKPMKMASPSGSQLKKAM